VTSFAWTRVGPEEWRLPAGFPGQALALA